MRLPKTALATVLLGGWILVEPPSVMVNRAEGLFDFRIELPVARWDVDGAYDTAKACEDWRATKLDLAGIGFNKTFGETDFEGQKRLMRSTTTGKAVPVHITDYVSFKHARCVPAEHIYPPKECGR